jgi:hypothetical protein
MKWEDRQPSQTVEDRRSDERDGETGLFDTTISFVAQGVGELVASVGIISDAEELREQLSSAQRELDLAMLDMREAGADESAIATLRAQAQNLVQLQRAVTDRGRGSLDDLKGPITAAIAASTAVAMSGRETALAAKGTDAASMAAISAATRREVESLSRDMHERKIFDPYLSFASAEEEAEYRRREAENKRYIDAELAKGTPEGDLNAAGAAQGQMLDTAAHGAADSPEFKERWEALEKTAREQREAVRASGGSTEEYDKRIEDSVRRFLRSKGLTEDEIDKAIAATHGDPLQAVKTYLESEKDAQALETEARAVGPVKESAASADTDLKDAIRGLRAAGTKITEEPCSVDPDHGLAGSGCGPMDRSLRR